MVVFYCVNNPDTLTPPETNLLEPGPQGTPGGVAVDVLCFKNSVLLSTADLSCLSPPSLHPSPPFPKKSEKKMKTEISKFQNFLKTIFQCACIGYASLPRSVLLPIPHPQLIERISLVLFAKI